MYIDKVAIRLRKIKSLRLKLRGKGRKIINGKKICRERRKHQKINQEIFRAIIKFSISCEQRCQVNQINCTPL